MSLRHLLWVGGFPELSHLLMLLSSQVLWADLLFGLGEEMSPHPQLPSVARLQVVGKRQASVTCFCWLGGCKMLLGSRGTVGGSPVWSGRVDEPPRAALCC